MVDHTHKSLVFWGDAHGMQDLFHRRLYAKALISGHLKRLTPQTHGGIVRDLLTFVANFGPGRGHWTAFVLPRQDTQGKTCGICNIATILKMKDTDRRNWVLPNGSGEKGKHVLLFSHKSVQCCWSSFPNIAKIFSQEIHDLFCANLLMARS